MPPDPESGERGTGRAASQRSHRTAARVLGYASVDASGQSELNHDLRQQVARITAECARRELALVGTVRECERHHAHAPQRPGLAYALGRISAGKVGGLIVDDLSRLGHSIPELGRILEWFIRADARLIAVGERLDTEDEAGRLAIRTIIRVSRRERERLVERTRIGMRAARSKGPASVADFPDLRARIVAMRAEGMTLQAIADRLNSEGVPTVRGGALWRPSSVQAAVGYRRPPGDHTLPITGGRQRPPADQALQPPADNTHTISDHWLAPTEDQMPPRAGQDRLGRA